MNFVGCQKSEEVRVELKYCERCGGLWLRARGSEGVHCASCLVRLAARPDTGEMPVASTSNRKARLPGSTPSRKLPISARIDHLQGVATIEVRG